MKITQRTIQILLISVVVMIVGVVGMLWVRHQQPPLSALRTVPVKRSDLVAVIGATGTVEPEEVVDIGAQVAGQISVFGKDKNGQSIDYGSVVDENTILAQIDNSLYAAAVESTKAQLQQAQANKISADSNVLQMQAKLVAAQQDWNRAQKIGPSEALAPSAYDQYKATYEVAKANLAVAQASVEQMKAAIAQAEANLNSAQRNLGYCTIKSPVKGVIIDRRVNIGQTVVSSLNAPSLFLLAKDLHRIKVWVSVNEADIGNIHPGQTAMFTVDAFPGRVFHGQVGKVRLNATMTQNVVTYTVEVNTENSDGKLLPYLTANVQFETGRRQNVLVVPNTALRWWPSLNQIAPEFRHKNVGEGRPSGQTVSDDAGREGGAPAHGTVWMPQDKFVRPVKVVVGLTDGTMTEVSGRDVTDNLTVVVSEQIPESTPTAGGGSPFTPQLGRARSAATSGGSR